MRKSTYPIEAKSLGQKIKKVRMDLNLSLAHVAKQAGISESFLWRIEEDRQLPKPNNFNSIAQALSLSLLTRQEYHKLVFDNAHENNTESIKTTKHELFMSQFAPHLTGRDHQTAAKKILHNANPAHKPSDNEIKSIIPLLKELQQATVEFERKSRSAEGRLEAVVNSILNKTHP